VYGHDGGLPGQRPSLVDASSCVHDDRVTAARALQVVVLGRRRLVVDAIAAALADRGAITTTGSPADDPAAISPSADVVLVDLAAGAQAEDANVLHDLGTPAPALILTDRDRRDLGEVAAATGASIVSSDLDADQLWRVVNDAAAGRSIAAATFGGPHGEARALGLTDRELEILRCLARGGRNDDVARSLDISVNTVRTHLQNIRAKLGVTTKLGAVTAARRAGILSESPTARGA
jgi:DNA-binding NarL/FixJ family response regulator